MAAQQYDGERAALDTRRVAANVVDALTRAHVDLTQQLAGGLSTSASRVQAAGLRDLVGGLLDDLGVNMDDEEHGLRL